jgi:type I restriction enzyme S subunit
MSVDWQTAGWPAVRIRDIGRLHGGGTPSRKRPEFFQGTIPWITGQDIPESHVAEITMARDYVTDDAVQESATRVVPAGAVLITTRVSVGKTAVAGCPICFSQDVTAILIHSVAIAFPAYVAHFLRSRRDALLQKNQGSTIAGITRDSLALEQIPLPPLSEQQQIAEILQEAEEIRRLRIEAEAKTAQLIPAMFRGLFGEIGSNSNGWPMVPVSHFVESFQGGKSLTGIEGDFDASRPRVLKISAVTSGVLVPTESKALPSFYEPPDEHFVKPGDLLITRANTAELVGATALIGKKCPSNLVLPDKIWRFIWKDNFQGTSEFVWALFQEQATRQALGNIASGTGGSMKNISMKKLMQMRVVWPPRELQEKFSEIVREVANLSDASQGDKASQTLQLALSAHAFSGQLTADWRNVHADELAIESRERDAALKKSGATVSRSRRATIKEMDRLFEQRADGIYSDLNREQRNLLLHIQQLFDGVPYVRYFSAQFLSESLKGSLRHNPQAIEGHLIVFSVRGLIIPVSREEQTEDTGEFIFGSAYRLPLSDKEEVVTDEKGERIVTETGEGIIADQVIGDRSRLRELQRLAGKLEKERVLT